MTLREFKEVLTNKPFSTHIKIYCNEPKSNILISKEYEILVDFYQDKEHDNLEIGFILIDIDLIFIYLKQHDYKQSKI